jgi:hypothetical protein
MNVPITFRNKQPFPQMHRQQHGSTLIYNASTLYNYLYTLAILYGRVLHHIASTSLVFLGVPLIVNCDAVFIEGHGVRVSDLVTDPALFYFSE